MPCRDPARNQRFCGDSSYLDVGSRHGVTRSHRWGEGNGARQGAGGERSLPRADSAAAGTTAAGAMAATRAGTPTPTTAGRTAGAKAGEGR